MLEILVWSRGLGFENFQSTRISQPNLWGQRKYNYKLTEAVSFETWLDIWMLFKKVIAQAVAGCCREGQQISTDTLYRRKNRCIHFFTNSLVQGTPPRWSNMLLSFAKHCQAPVGQVQSQVLTESWSTVCPSNGLPDVRWWKLGMRRLAAVARSSPELRSPWQVLSQWKEHCMHCILLL